MKCWQKAARFAHPLAFLFAMLLPAAACAQAADSHTHAGLWFAFAAGVCVGIAALSLVCLAYRAKKKKAVAKELPTEAPSVGDKAYFLNRCHAIIHDGVRPLYFVFFFGFDLGHADARPDDAEAESILRYAANTLFESVSSSDFYAQVSGGFVVACRSVCCEKAEDWAGQVLIRLNRYGEKSSKGFVPVFRAGIYRLGKRDTEWGSVLFAAQRGYRQAVEQSVPYCLIDVEKLNDTLKKEAQRDRSIKAIAGHEFTCFLQCIVCSDTDEVYGAEVLSRWVHPQQGLLMPSTYIGDMEYNETIIEMDFYMLEETCRLLELFSDMGWPSYRLFCNVSRKTFSLPDFVERVLAIAGRYRFAHKNLYLEITESMMFDNTQTAGENAKKCRASGFGIALDDIGCGFSSFGDLANCPLDVAKIDRSLLLGATQENGRRLLNGLNELFHNLQVRTLCEGVETQEQQALVRSLGIDYIQGYLIQKPLSVQDAVQWLRERRKAQG